MNRPPQASPATEFDLPSRLQFLHPEKTLALWELPHSPEADPDLLAGILGTDAVTYASLRDDLYGAAHQAAVELLEDSKLEAAVDSLPFASGDVVVALGDSITDDYQSWAEILRELLAIRRPRDSIRVANHGISGDTTADVLGRFWSVAATNPTWIIALLSTNDARRDRATGEMLVSHEETARNLSLIRRGSLASGVHHFLWMTPPPVHEGRIAADERAAARGVTWSNADLLEKARIVRSQPDLSVDLGATFDPDELADLLLPDGLHPSLVGQKRIVATLLTTFAACKNTRRPAR